MICMQLVYFYLYYLIGFGLKSIICKATVLQ